MFTTAEMNAGRKLSARADEPWVEGSDQLVRVDYTYWTLAYILSATGEPLSWVYYKEISSPYSAYIAVPVLCRNFIRQSSVEVLALDDSQLTEAGRWGRGGGVYQAGVEPVTMCSVPKQQSSCDSK
jgi:hypothetical protein